MDVAHRRDGQSASTAAGVEQIDVQGVEVARGQLLQPHRTDARDDVGGQLVAVGGDGARFAMVDLAVDPPEQVLLDRHGAAGSVGPPCQPHARLVAGDLGRSAGRVTPLPPLPALPSEAEASAAAQTLSQRHTVDPVQPVAIEAALSRLLADVDHERPRAAR